MLAPQAMNGKSSSLAFCDKKEAAAHATQTNRDNFVTNFSEGTVSSTVFSFACFSWSGHARVVTGFGMSADTGGRRWVRDYKQQAGKLKCSNCGCLLISNQSLRSRRPSGTEDLSTRPRTAPWTLTNSDPRKKQHHTPSPGPFAARWFEANAFLVLFLQHRSTKTHTEPNPCTASCLFCSLCRRCALDRQFVLCLTVHGQTSASNVNCAKLALLPGTFLLLKMKG